VLYLLQTDLHIYTLTLWLGLQRSSLFPPDDRWQDASDLEAGPCKSGARGFPSLTGTSGTQSLYVTMIHFTKITSRYCRDLALDHSHLAIG
jgi:hypothetical protein